MTFTKTSPDASHLPLLNHPLHEPSTFRPEDLVEAVRGQRRLDALDLPEVCVLDFDGDITDALVDAREVWACEGWPCFHTSMWALPVGGFHCGLIARTIGGPYAVLVAEQLVVCGVRVIIGLASAGGVGSGLPVPGVVVADRAIRDEGTSYHYLPAGETVEALPSLADALEAEVTAVGLPVRRGLVWTTDAPYRETSGQLDRYSRMGALAVEMQAASLFAFAAARNVAVGVVAHVTNTPEQDGEPLTKAHATFNSSCFTRSVAVPTASRSWVDRDRPGRGLDVTLHNDHFVSGEALPAAPYPASPPLGTHNGLGC